MSTPIFKSKIVIVTGGASGIGKAISLAFAQQEAEVVIFDINKKLGKNTLQLLRKFNKKALFIDGDVSNEDDVKRATKEVIKRFKRINVLVNNAGIHLAKPIERTSLKEYEKAVGVNLKGNFLFSKYTIPYLRKAKGTIINISSGVGILPDKDAPIYSMTKAGIIMLTKCLALKNGKYGVRINAVCPGSVDTQMLREAFHFSKKDLRGCAQMNPLKRIAKPKEIAEVVLFLASEKASFVNGAVWTVDGGESINYCGEPVK